MKVIKHDACQIAYYGEYEKGLKKAGIDYRMIKKGLKVFDMSVIAASGTEFDVFEYEKNGKKRLLCTSCFASGDDFIEEAYVIELENEDYTLEIIADTLYKYIKDREKHAIV